MGYVIFLAIAFVMLFVEWLAVDARSRTPRHEDRPRT